MADIIDFKPKEVNEDYTLDEDEQLIFDIIDEYTEELFKKDTVSAQEIFDVMINLYFTAYDIGSDDTKLRIIDALEKELYVFDE